MKTRFLRSGGTQNRVEIDKKAIQKTSAEKRRQKEEKRSILELQKWPQIVKKRFWKRIEIKDEKRKQKRAEK